jgi:hypothetical protein
VADDSPTLRYEFVAEIVHESAADDTIRFRYVIAEDGPPEISIPSEWWESLGRPDFISVGVTPEVDYNAP